MRVALGFVLGWFGVLQAREPTDWIEFVPGYVSRLSPVSDTVLVLLHSSLLLLAAVGVLIGLQFLAAAVLAVAAISQIIVALVLEDGSLTLIVRDIGILGLAVGLALDQSRFWQLDSVRPDPWGWNRLWWVWRIGIPATAMGAVALLVVLLWSV